MIPEAHVCCKCKREVVWTDCLPAVCYKCRDKEREWEQERVRQALPRPDVVVAEGEGVSER